MFAVEITQNVAENPSLGGAVGSEDGDEAWCWGFEGKGERQESGRGGDRGEVMRAAGVLAGGRGWI